MPVSKSSSLPRLSAARLGAAAGMIGPVMYLGVLGILDLLNNKVEGSGHELSRYGIVMHLDFLIFGVLLLAFASGLRREIRRGKLAWLGTVLLWMLGLGPLLATFTLDTAPGPPSTWHGALHDVGFLLVALAPIPVCFVFALVFRGDPRWRGYSWYSLATGIVVTAVVFAPSTSSGDAYPIWTGPASMLDQVLVFAWVELVAIRLWRLTRETRPQDETTGTGATTGTVVIGER
jgi:hypothetical protein